MNKEIDSSSSPATQEDLEIWGGNLAFQIDEVRQEQTKQGETIETIKAEQTKQGETIETIKAEQTKQSRILGDILSVNQAILGQLSEMKKVPELVENHEERITDLEVKVRIMQQ